MTHEFLVFIAKSFGLIWMMSFFLAVVVIAYWPGRRHLYDQAARSVLESSDGEGAE